MRDSMVFYRSFYEALTELEPDAFKSVMIAIFEYAMDGKVPELSGTAKMAFTLIKPQIDANNKRAENGKYGYLGAEYGKMGGRPRKNPQKPPMGDTPKPPNVNVNVNDNVNNTKIPSNKFCKFPSNDSEYQALKKNIFVNVEGKDG